ncbi:LacI family DNA-binding transcriptional regulator [Ktedonospora formicarum]|uniref:LacI family transcriptional regulator n=1 Tax=Ktedonospora formicarum TaxID=2778364 RepID=A0A8J3HXF0_9CHLR|nr:LacI family DNA-binding transcriptional regulator [Ktedonospora formicarum]GHO42427.1 LacI family transcriptional regulator [Ktedonospora formicarum]
MPKVTIYDVAKKAGVSAATVSKILNGTGRISQETRQRVLAAIEALHYRPSMIATALKKHQTFSIGLLIPDITNPFYAGLARAVEDHALAHNYSLLMCSTDNTAEREERQLEHVLRQQLDGLIVATSEAMSPEILTTLHHAQVRVVFVDRVLPNLPYPVIATDHYQGSYLATRHLLDLGHQDITVFLEPLSLHSSLERLRGFARALEEQSIRFDNTSMFSEGFGVEAGYKLAQRLLAQRGTASQLPTAIFASTDQLAIGALQYFHEVHIAVPEHISIIGYDDIQMARIVSPPLTTVAQPITAIGQQAVELLISGRTLMATTVLLPPQIVVRASTAAPRSCEA